MNDKRAGDGLESAFAKFGGLTEEILFDNARALVIDHDVAIGHGPAPPTAPAPKERPRTASAT